MSDFQRPRVENRISLGNVLTICTGIIALAAAWGTLQADIRALAQRVDKGETRDDDAAKTLTDLRGAVIELRTDQRAIRAETERQGRQLDRIEHQQQQLLQQFKKGVP